MFKSGLIALLFVSLVFAEPSTEFLGTKSLSGSSTRDEGETTDQECLVSLERVDTLIEDTSEWQAGDHTLFSLGHILTSYDYIYENCTGQLTTSNIMDCTNDIESVVSKLQQIAVTIEEEGTDADIAEISPTSLGRVKSTCIEAVAQAVCENQVEAPQESFNELYNEYMAADVTGDDTEQGLLKDLATTALAELEAVYGACVYYGGMEGNNAFNTIENVLYEVINLLRKCSESEDGSECHFDEEDLSTLYEVLINNNSLPAFEDPVQEDNADETQGDQDDASSVEESGVSEETEGATVTEEVEESSVDILVSQQ